MPVAAGMQRRRGRPAVIRVRGAGPPQRVEPVDPLPRERVECAVHFLGNGWNARSTAIYQVQKLNPPAGQQLKPAIHLLPKGTLLRLRASMGAAVESRARPRRGLSGLGAG